MSISRDRKRLFQVFCYTYSTHQDHIPRGQILPDQQAPSSAAHKTIINTLKFR